MRSVIFKKPQRLTWVTFMEEAVCSPNALIKCDDPVVKYYDFIVFKIDQLRGYKLIAPNNLLYRFFRIFFRGKERILYFLCKMWGLSVIKAHKNGWIKAEEGVIPTFKNVYKWWKSARLERKSFK